MPSEQLDRLTERLERAAAELRAGSLDPDRAAAVVDECARLAGEACAVSYTHLTLPTNREV